MEEDDELQLSAETFNALQEFYKEQEVKEKIKSSLDNSALLEENWQLSQFWYDHVTVEVFVKLALKITDTCGKIALVSCPTLYKPIKKQVDLSTEVTLFEYDQRFTLYGPDFISYDYKSPLNIPHEREHYYDLVIADPPFLSDECLTKTAVTIRFLTKRNIIICTGAVMADLAIKLLGLKKCKFVPLHKNNLANEFCCLSNFDIDSLL